MGSKTNDIKSKQKIKQTFKIVKIVKQKGHDGHASLPWEARYIHVCKKRPQMPNIRSLCY